MHACTQCTLTRLLLTARGRPRAGTGWTFPRAEPNPMREATSAALYTYRHDPEAFRAMQRRGMAQDLSWDNAASLYEEVLVEAKYQW